VASVSDQALEATAGRDAADASLLALIDRLAALVDETGLAELEIEVGGTTVTVRAPSAIDAMVGGAGVPATPGGAGSAGAAAVAVPAIRSVTAPLTGIWYAAPTPGSTPFVSVGAEIGAGQVVGLIEAMKLFNEIKSDVAGRVTRVLAENGQLVKARQVLIEVEPL
jgi:acetyl-CoA carboxylase biotin carboxyl carrier protein